MHCKHGFDFKTWTMSGKDTGSITEDPKLNTTTFQFYKDSPALKKIGFKPINISLIGPSSIAYKRRMIGKEVFEHLVQEELVNGV